MDLIEALEGTAPKATEFLNLIAHFSPLFTVIPTLYSKGFVMFVVGIIAEPLFAQAIGVITTFPSKS